MFLGILSPLFKSFSTVFWKRSMSYWITGFLFTLTWSFWEIILSFIFIIFGFSAFFWLSLWLFLIIIFDDILYVFAALISQYVYKNEKISILAPYENINKILTIIFSFFIFTDVSFLSFLITLIAWIIVIYNSIDFKNFWFPKFLKLFFIYQLILSITILLTWYILMKISAIDYYVLCNFIFAVFIWTIVLARRDLLLLNWLDKKYYIFRFSWALLQTLAFLLSLFIIWALWVTMSMLFSYLYIWFVLFMSYIFFKDIPSKKNIILIVVLSLLVWLWYYFK